MAPVTGRSSGSPGEAAGAKAEPGSPATPDSEGSSAPWLKSSTLTYRRVFTAKSLPLVVLDNKVKILLLMKNPHEHTCSSGTIPPLSCSHRPSRAPAFSGTATRRISVLAHTPGPSVTTLASLGLSFQNLQLCLFSARQINPALELGGGDKATAAVSSGFKPSSSLLAKGNDRHPHARQASQMGPNGPPTRDLCPCAEGCAFPSCHQTLWSPCLEYFLK